MRERLLLTTLLTIASGFAAFGLLTTKPRNEYVFLGGANLAMNCSSTLGSGSITWFFISAGDNVNVTIASGSTVYLAFAQLFGISQPAADQSNLIIPRPDDSTAGTFTCADRETFGHAQLIILHSISQSTNASSNLIIGDVIRYSCQLVYLYEPVFIPIFYLARFWPSEEIDKTTSLQLEKSNSLTTATATFYQTVSCLSFLNMQCVLKFGEPVGSLLPGFATGAPSRATSFNFPAAKVSCPPSIIGAVSGDTLYFGAILTCQLIVARPVNYSWTDLTYGNTTIGPQLTVLHGGSYQCMASINSAESWSTSEKAVYNLTVEKPSLKAQQLFGPIAGGTKVTLTLDNWSKEVANISVVYLGDTLKITDIQSDRVGNSVMMTTLNATEALIGQPLLITIEFTPGPYNITSNSSFTYKGNPEITGISPSTFVATGGTIVNVTGTQLSSVAIPIIQVTIVVERGIEKNTTREKSFEPCEVNPEDGSRMTCRMPNVSIPDDFLQVLDSQYNNRSKRDTNSMNHLKAEVPILLSRRKRYANALSLIGPNGVDQLFIYLGFILDGYQKYDNINNALPDTQILIFSPPEISFTKDIVEFDPNKDESISIKGKHMTRGSRLVDYVVKVGADVCENIDLTDNQLRCRPPKQQPQSTQNTSTYCDQLLTIYIHLGYKTYQYACVKYSTPPPVLIIGLAVGLSSFVIIILVIIAIVFCCKKSRNNRPTKNTLGSSADTANDSYLQGSAKSHNSEAYLRPPAQSNADEAYLSPSVQ